jgi:hypothetical protein
VCGLGLVAGREKMQGATDMVTKGRDHETDSPRRHGEKEERQRQQNREREG